VNERDSEGAAGRARVLLIDNYDSFVGNLYQYLGELGAEPILRRNDAVTPEEALSLGITHLVISPGPKTPAEAGVSVEMVRAFAGAVPVLGVCLGHQAIGVAFGGRVARARELVHGKASRIRHTGQGVLRGIPDPFTAGRYHSLVVDRGSLPEDLLVTAWTEDGEVMGLLHRGYAEVPVEGVQFHPESILTDHGRRLLRNFLAGGRR
jgi:anthranilate synthase component 2